MAIQAFLALRAQRKVKNMLVVSTPKIIHLVWPKEVMKWGVPIKLALAHGSKWEQAMDSDADVYLTTYDSLEKICDYVLDAFSRGRKFDMLLLDESTKIKSSKTERFKNVSPVLKLFKRRVLMTGNLTPHSYLDLWSQMFMMDLGKSLGDSFNQYRLTYFKPAGYKGKNWALAEGADKVIIRKIKKLVLRIGPEELDEPPIYPVARFVELSPKVMRMYEEMEEEYVLDLQRRGVIIASTAGSAVMKLRQIVSGAVYQTSEYQKGRKVQELHSEKLDELSQLVEELGDEPLLVGYYFEHELSRLKKRFPQAQVIGDKNTMAENSHVEDAWNAGDVPVLLANIDAVSHGQNMQGHGCHIAIYTDTYNYENHFQFIKRVHRTGQKRPVTVHYLQAVGTIDEVVFKAITDKEANQEKLWRALSERYLP